MDIYAVEYEIKIETYDGPPSVCKRFEIITAPSAKHAELAITKAFPGSLVHPAKFLVSSNQILR